MLPSESTVLHFAYTSNVPEIDAFDVKSIAPATLLGAPSAFTVIGESHFVGVPSIRFHEVCSCNARSGDAAFTLPLERGVEREYDFENDHVRVETTAAVRRIDAFPVADGATVAYRFGSDAWTTITVSDSTPVDDRNEANRTGAYETYHTYPEYALAVYTNTRLTPSANETARRNPASNNHTPESSTHD